MLYRKGLKPLFYSCKQASRRGIGWHRLGSDICFFKTSSAHASLTFTFNLPYDNDTVFFALAHPYTYISMLGHLHTLVTNPRTRDHLEVSTLCETVNGNKCPIVSITDGIRNKGMLKRERDVKPIVVCSARVHPGEVCSSHMMRGILDFLTSSHPHAQTLRRTFVFKLVHYTISPESPSQNYTPEYPIIIINNPLRNTKKLRINPC